LPQNKVVLFFTHVALRSYDLDRMNSLPAAGRDELDYGQENDQSRSHYVKQKHGKIIYFGYYAFLSVPGRYFHHTGFYFSTWQREFLNGDWPNI
jgi:hypothetical protein